jgi:DNA-binding GntR family transcriptional regulator
MHRDARATQAAGDAQLQRAIVVTLLNDDHPQIWPQAELAAELQADRAVLQGALERLAADGAVSLSNEDVQATRALRRLDELGLIAL